MVNDEDSRIARYIRGDGFPDGDTNMKRAARDAVYMVVDRLLESKELQDKFEEHASLSEAINKVVTNMKGKIEANIGKRYRKTEQS